MASSFSDVMDFVETVSNQSMKALCNRSRITYGYCETICNGAARLSSHFVQMYASHTEPYDCVNNSPSIKELVDLIKKLSFSEEK